MACGSLLLCAGLEDGIEGATHVIGKRQRDRNTQEAVGGLEEESEEERNVAAGKS